jgi:hypothetical protein
MKSGALLAAKIGVSLALLIYLFSTTDREALLLRVRGGDVLLFACAVALYGGMLAISTWRWRLLLQALGFPARLRDLTSSYLVATFFNNFLPSNIGGDVIRIRDTTQPAGSIGRATAIVVIDRAMGLLGLLLVAAVSGSLAVIGMAGPTLPVNLPWLWLAFVTATGAFLILLLAPQTILTVLCYVRFLNRDAIVTRVRKLVDMMRAFRAQPLALVSCFAGALVAQAVLVAFYVAIARSLEIPISPLHLAVVVPMSLVVQLLPVSVNGFGVREATFTYYFAALHLPIESALVLSVLGAGLVLLFSLSGGVLYVARR